MPRDLMPLFVFKPRGEQDLKEAGAVVTAGGESYKASSFIEEVTQKIEDDVDSVMKGDEMGELTIAAYILLESLHRVGMTKVADSLLSEPQNLFHSALCTAIGVRAGMQIPGDTKFETTTSDSNFSIRNLTVGEDEDPD